MGTDQALIDELRGTIVRLRSALAESMEWGWSSDPPPAHVVERCESALGITDDVPESFPRARATVGHAA